MRIAATIATVLLAGCASGAAPRSVPSGAEDNPCRRGDEVYITSGLFAWLPVGTEVSVGMTADNVPHAEAGGTFTLDGEDVEVWRALQYGPDDVPSAVGRTDHGVAVFVRTNDPGRQRCVLAGLRYDPSRDLD